MRIISKFTDYYDCAQSYGIDPNLIYMRTPRELVFGPSSGHLPIAIEACRSVPKCSRVGSFQPAILGFCGKLYRVFTLDERRPAGHEMTSVPFLTSGAAVELVRKRAADGAHDYRLGRAAKAWLAEGHEFTSLNEWHRKGDYRFPIHVKRSEWEQLTQPITHSSNLELFHVVQAPVFLMQFIWMDKITVKTNISLKDTGFIQVFDPFTAYQEIAMFLGGVLALPKEQSPLTVGGDKIIAQQKGFDEKSFRGPEKGEVDSRRRANRKRKRGTED